VRGGKHLSLSSYTRLESGVNSPNLDRYVDAFCGRVPKSVLGKRYTDYSPERLKEIYEGAKIHVLF